MHETEEKTLNSLVPLGLIHAFQGWFRGFQGQRVGDPWPCPLCGETTVLEERLPDGSALRHPERGDNPGSTIITV